MGRQFITLLVLILQYLIGMTWASTAAMTTDRLMRFSNKRLADMGQQYWDKDQLDSALICLSVISERGKNDLPESEMIYVAAATKAMGNIYMNRYYDYERAMKCLLRAEQISQDYHFDKQLVEVYELMAVLEDGKNDLQTDYQFNATSFDLHRKAFQTAVKMQSMHDVMVLSMMNMTTAALGHSKLDVIENELLMFQRLNIRDSVPASRFAQHQCAAALYVLHQQYDEAIAEMRQMQESLNVIDHVRPVYQAIAHENLYFVYRDMGHADSALVQLENMERIARDNDIKNAIIEVLLHKCKFYRNLGLDGLANDCELEYRKEKEQFMAEAKIAKADEEKVLFRLNEANMEIKELSYRQRIQLIILIAVIVVAGLLLALLALGWRNHRNTQTKNRLLYDQNRQLLLHIDRLRQLRLEQESKQQVQQPAQDAAVESTSQAKYGRGKMDDGDIERVMDKVERVMDSSLEVFSTEFSLDQMAELTGETRARLSQAINGVPGRTFYSILNEYRVREACRRMNNKQQYGGFTIEAIAKSVGFKSRSNFVSTFKRITGLTPSAYLKHGSEAPDDGKP